MPLKVKEIIKLVESDGWNHERTTGSHRHFKHPTKPGIVTIPGKLSDTLRPGTESSILRQAGMK